MTAVFSKVIEAKAYAFSGLGSFKIPSSIVEIRWRAFYCCRGLESSEFPPSIEKIEPEAYAFSGLETVKIPPSTTVERRAFYCCRELKSVILPPSVEVESETYAFSGLETVIIPSSAKIGDRAFYCCRNLRSVFIPPSAEIGKEVFLYCPNLLLNFSCRYLASASTKLRVKIFLLSLQRNDLTLPNELLWLILEHLPLN